MIFARIGHGSCYYCWNEIFAGVYLIIPRDIYSVAQWVKTVFWFSIVVFCTSQVLRNTLKIVRKIEETSPQVHMQYEMRVHTTLDIISILTRKYVDKMTP